MLEDARTSPFDVTKLPEDASGDLIGDAVLEFEDFLRAGGILDWSTWSKMSRMSRVALGTAAHRLHRESAEALAALAPIRAPMSPPQPPPPDDEVTESLLAATEKALP